MKAMARQQRSHSIEFKRQVVQEYIAGETLYGLAKRHDLSRQLIRVWVEKYEAGGLDADAQAADLLHEYETKIVALERMVGLSLPRNDYFEVRTRLGPLATDYLQNARDVIVHSHDCRLRHPYPCPAPVLGYQKGAGQPLIWIN